MAAKVKKIDILEVELPFREAFRHASRKRQSSGSVFVKIYLENGIIGYGEALPREYVTGESTGSVREKLDHELKSLLGTEFSSLKEAAEFSRKYDGLKGAAKCAAELAVLDVLGRYFGESISSVLGERLTDEVFYSGVVSAGSVPSAVKDAVRFKLFGFGQVKVKVGAEDDLKRLEVIRSILGGKVDIRVDANCAWEAEEAIENINKMRKFSISAVEQPVKKDDIAGLKKVTESVPEKIIADESLCTVEDAKKLSSERACNMFNVRLSKCGGIFSALKIADIARNSSIGYQLGCQAGESGVLSAAGRHFACSVKGIEYFEGSYGRFLLKDDITVENMTFGWKGKAAALDGYGLGVNVSDEVLEKYIVSRTSLE